MSVPLVVHSRFQKTKSDDLKNSQIFSQIHNPPPHIFACRATFLESIISQTAIKFVSSFGSTSTLEIFFISGYGTECLLYTCVNAVMLIRNPVIVRPIERNNFTSMLCIFIVDNTKYFLVFQTLNILFLFSLMTTLKIKARCTF